MPLLLAGHQIQFKTLLHLLLASCKGVTCALAATGSETPPLPAGRHAGPCEELPDGAKPDHPHPAGQAGAGHMAGVCSWRADCFCSSSCFNLNPAAVHAVFSATLSPHTAAAVCGTQVPEIASLAAGSTSSKQATPAAAWADGHHWVVVAAGDLPQ